MEINSAAELRQAIDARSAQAQQATTPTHEELARMEVDDLKELCQQRGLRVGGTKAVLIERLMEDYDKRLQFVKLNVGPHFPTISATDLATVITWTDQFEMVSPCPLALNFVTGDFSVFAQALASNETLTHFTWKKARLPKIKAAALGQALAQLPRLQSITVHGWGVKRHLLMALPVVQNTNNSLQIINLSGDPGYSPEYHVRYGSKLKMFLQGCKTSARLVALNMSGICWPPSQLEAAKDLLEQTASLESLSVFISHDFDLIGFLESLKTNRTLKHLTVSGRYRVSGYFLKEILWQEAGALLGILEGHNFTLEGINIGPWLTTRRVYGLSELEHLRLQALVSGILFLCDLNKHGRGQMRGPSANPTAENWINKLAATNDISVLYYYVGLGLEESFFDPARGRTNTAGRDRKRTHAMLEVAQDLILEAERGTPALTLGERTDLAGIAASMRCVLAKIGEK